MTSTRLKNPRVALADNQVSEQERVTGQGRTVSQKPTDLCYVKNTPHFTRLSRRAPVQVKCGGLNDPKNTILLEGPRIFDHWRGPTKHSGPKREPWGTHQRPKRRKETEANLEGLPTWNCHPTHCYRNYKYSLTYIGKRVGQWDEFDLTLSFSLRHLSFLDPPFTWPSERRSLDHNLRVPFLWVQPRKGVRQLICTRHPVSPSFRLTSSSKRYGKFPKHAQIQILSLIFLHLVNIFFHNDNSIDIFHHYNYFNSLNQNLIIGYEKLR